MTTNTTPVSPPSRIDPRQVTNTLKRTLNWNDGDVALAAFANSLPLGAFITRVLVEIVTAFDGTTPTLVVGTNSATYNDIVAAADVNEAAAGVTEVTRGLGRSIAATAEKAVFAKATLTNATQGKAIIVIEYEGGWAS
jgi:hypothetical protein